VSSCLGLRGPPSNGRPRGRSIRHSGSRHHFLLLLMNIHTGTRTGTLTGTAMEGPRTGDRPSPVFPVIHTMAIPTIIIMGDKVTIRSIGGSDFLAVQLRGALTGSSLPGPSSQPAQSPIRPPDSFLSCACFAAPPSLLPRLSFRW
jgi:hypothetical protein